MREKLKIIYPGFLEGGQCQARWSRKYARTLASLIDNIPR